jgi:hypothetical protein
MEPRDGFFHAMLSYRVNTDQDFVSKLHDKIHLLAPVGEKGWHASAYPAGFRRDESVMNSSVCVFQDSYCLRDGMGWEGDGGIKNGGFIGALRLSLIFVPVFSVKVNGDSEIVSPGAGSIGQLIDLEVEDKQDNVLLELILARELHLLSKKSGKNALSPCSYILPLFRNKEVWAAVKKLPNKPSHITNAKALHVMKQLGVPPSALSVELSSGVLSVKAVWDFFSQFQGIMLFDFGKESFQIVGAAKAILDVARLSISDFNLHNMDMNFAQLYELHGFMSKLNMANYTSILAAHDITNVGQLADLHRSGSEVIMQSVADQCAKASGDSTLPNELVKLRSAVAAAALSHLGVPLNDRFERFIDHDASFATMLSSSCLFDIVLSKKMSWIFIVPAMLKTVSDNVHPILIYNPTGMFPSNRSLAFAHHASSITACLIIALIACPVAFLKSPRHSRFCVAAALFVWASIYTFNYAVSIHSAIYNDCVNCAAPTLATFSVSQKIVAQPTTGVIFWAALFCALFKQQYTIRICLTLLICVSIPPLVLFIAGISTFDTASSSFYIFGNMLGWSSAYVSMKILQFIGNQRARSILNINANITETVFQNMCASYPTFLSFANSGPEPPTACLLGWCGKRRDISHRSITLGAPGEHLQTILSADVPVQSTGYVDIHSIVLKHNIGKGQMLQQHDSFESLIRDAEFINLSFQEWVSSWLSNGPPLDKVQRLFYHSDAGVHPSLASLSSNNPALPIHGAHLRGPVKRLDRSIEKVCTSTAALLTLSLSDKDATFPLQF